MQPSPRLETVSGWEVPRVRGVGAMPPLKTLECAPGQGGPSLGVEDALVDADLVVDRAQVAGHLGQLLLDAGTVVLEQGKALGLVAATCAHERGVPAYVADGHARRAQPGDHLDP